MVRILLVDDHCLLRQVVRDTLERERDFEVVAEAANGAEAVRIAEETQPDVVLMDLVMPVCDGFEATRRILASSPQIRIVIFSASHQDEDLLYALQSGAVGYLVKNTGPVELVTAIRRAAQHEFSLFPPISGQLLALLRAQTPPAGSIPRREQRQIPEQSRKPRRSKRHLPLSQREQEVLGLIRQGQRNREIARELHISEATVHKHVQNIFAKLNARNRAEALFLAQA